LRANFLPEVILAIVVFGLFRWGCLRCSCVAGRAILNILGLAAATLAVLFASNYALDIPYASWFYELHARPGAEITTGLSAALLGIMFASSRLRPGRLNAPILAAWTLATVALILAPFAKQLFYAVDYDALGNRWDKGICIQTSHSTCVPACVATYVRMLGGRLTEPELARAAGSTSRGTELWYLVRALRRRGYEARFGHVRSVRNAPVPCILGVTVGQTGHVIILLGKDRHGVTIAEPLRGRRHYSWSFFRRCYKPGGSYTTITRPTRHNSTIR
jgi:hypothetical protein